MQIDERTIGDVLVLDVNGRITRSVKATILKRQGQQPSEPGQEEDRAQSGRGAARRQRRSRSDRPHVHHGEPSGGNLKLLNLTKRITICWPSRSCWTVRDLRVGIRRGPEFLGFSPGLSAVRARWRVQCPSTMTAANVLTDPRFDGAARSNACIRSSSSFRPSQCDEEPARLCPLILPSSCSDPVAAVRGGRVRRFCALSSVVYLINDISES